MVECPICANQVRPAKINDHIDSQCKDFILDSSAEAASTSSAPHPAAAPSTQQATQNGSASSQKRPPSSFFQTPSAKRHATPAKVLTPVANGTNGVMKLNGGTKRTFDDGPGASDYDLPSVPEAAATAEGGRQQQEANSHDESRPIAKRTKTNRAAPLAERMRPQNFSEVFGQELVGPTGVLRSLIEQDRVPSMILWGGSGTGKTTIARCIAQMVGSRFIELNATSSGVAECKKFFMEAENELKLTGATTENPSFKVVNALLSRCRTFTLQKLSTQHVLNILQRALQMEQTGSSQPPSPLLDEELLTYLATFADGDARTALNLLELAFSLSTRTEITKADIKAALTKTLVYDRAGDQHYDTISAFHKSVRGSDADAALYYLARMLQSGEDPLFVARRMVVIASEDVGLADNTLLPLATATYTATQQIGMPEARIPLAHCAVALCLAPKSTKAYRGLNNAYAALREPGVAGLPVPIHLRNAPTRLMRELSYGKEYKYNPNYRDGKVKQDYLPDDLVGRRFLEDRHLGTEIDPDVAMDEAPEAETAA
ncbi:ATPase [Apiospora rasikravindrae]|uniref:ATPase n=1 Tax=Apiospora rasikravindrae TaxID=990691 RepID=A0ABR1SZS1_9PEZI